MTVMCSSVLFALRPFLRFDVMAWVVGVPLLVGAIVLLVWQYRQYKALQAELKLLDKVKVHSVEYDLVLKTMKLAIWHFDVQTRRVTFEADYRDNADNIVFTPGTSVEDVLRMMAPAYAEYFRKSLEDLLQGRSEVAYVQFQMKVPHSDRSYWGETYASVDKRDLEGRPLSVVGTVMRIDQQKEIEKALMDAVYHAEESDRLKSAFLANISHEIRTPLNAIVGFSNVLSTVDNEEERQQLIALIRQNNDHLLRLFEDIVRMSKLEARGGDALKMSSFHLKDVYDDLVEIYKPKLEEKGLALVIADAETLPVLTADRDRVREILNQYMNNAMKFTETGQVTLGCNESGDKWRLWVRDTGKGIPEDMCNDRLFERFVKVDEFVSGTGLGLSICRSLALTMNGQVGVKSELGKGSVFWLDLQKE